MKLVTLTCDMRPWRANDRVPLPGDLADRLVASGEAVNPEPFGPQPEPATALGRVAEKVREKLTLPRGTYKAKGFS